MANSPETKKALTDTMGLLAEQMSTLAPFHRPLEGVDLSELVISTLLMQSRVVSVLEEMAAIERADCEPFLTLPFPSNE